jgi:electron transfer flavoprotein-quinone oxidoreductase
MEEKFEAIVVGAGPAGIAAALTLARAGVETIVFERGEYPGSKNVMGGILFTTILGKLIPDFAEEAPLERPVSKRRFSFFSEDSGISFDFQAKAFGQPPYNNSFTVLRAKFDQWFAQKAEEAGAMIINETVVDDLLWEGKKVVGVKARREEGEMLADVVIVADGANSLLARKAKMRENFTPYQRALGVKEIIALPPEVIDQRFNLVGNEGVAIECFGEAVKGMVGSGFLYTNKDSLSLGIGCSIHSLIEKEIKPNELLEQFKQHPLVAPLIAGGETKEYAAHLIPEGGYAHMPKIYGDGILLVGDSAGFVNTSLYHEGSNLAMASGMMAAQAVIRAKEKKDFSAAALSHYQELLNQSFVLKDIKKFRHVHGFAAKNPHFFDQYPKLFVDLAKEFFTIDERSKDEIQQRIKKEFRGRVKLWDFLMDLNKARKALI